MAVYVYPALKDIGTAYDRDGFVIVRNVLPADLIQEVDRHIDWLIERHPDLPPESLGHWLIADDPFWVRFLSDRTLLDVAEALVGPDVAFFAADYICKPPRTGKGVLWHQDGHYWPLEPMDVITVWFAVTASLPANGCVRVIPGSHRTGLHSHSPERKENYILNQADPGAFDESRAVDLTLAPGDISVHHPLLLHGSNPNESNEWRRGGSIQYMPATTKVTRDWPCLFLFRGTPVEGVNDYRTFPAYQDGEHMSFTGCEAWS